MKSVTVQLPHGEATYTQDELLERITNDINSDTPKTEFTYTWHVEMISLVLPALKLRNLNFTVITPVELWNTNEVQLTVKL